ncbi:MAG: acyloxyacyl hydrolase [Phycisphaerae bacterium]|nr:acyloxyacyl hydrolase [Phycisphaerae bacterium]MCZ2401271.1 acyloxyacyl hydrolase [Phycisphaerae bacterium]NUQ49807.1 acyloxyacyl hydrolase [Phycisphaerae bacterium]
MRKLVAVCVLASFWALQAGCAGGLHRQGEHQLSLTAGYGRPFKGTALYPDAEGRAENAGVTVGYGYFATDRLALLAAGTPLRVYNQGDGDVAAGELQVGLRYYVWEFDLAGTPVGLFGEVLGGMMNGSRSVPEGGSHTNFTQDTGVGCEVQLTRRVSWISGYRLRHLSNGRIFRTDSNPSQNDHFVYTGVAFSFP